MLAAAQDDYRGVMEHLVRAMLMDEPPAAELELLVGETLAVGANAGTCILLDESLRDYRDLVGTYRLPTLLTWVATRSSSGSRAASGWPSGSRASLVVFERSDHCPMWEEAERFNQVVGDWIASLIP